MWRMAKFYEEITPELQVFIEAQQVFFVATAAADGRINLSPKGMDSLRVLAPDRVAWLSVTGSGNETAAHLLENDRITLMLCAFEGKPLILRIYGTARAVYPNDAEWSQLAPSFPELPGARQIFELKVESTQTSCGMGVPRLRFEEERGELNRWAEKKGEGGLRDYQQAKNSVSIDGKPTGMPD